MLAGCGSKTKEELVAEGTALMKSNPNGAIVLFKSALEKDQNYVEARYQLAKAYEKSGKMEQAEKEFQKVILQDPSREDISLSLAQLYADTKRPDLALSEADNYLKKHAGSVEALEIKGRALAMKGSFAEAETLLIQAIAADESRMNSRLTLASIYLSQGREEDARKVVSEILERDSKNKTAYYILAGIYGRHGDKEKVMATYRTISELDPKDFTSLFRMGLLHLDTKDNVSAEKFADLLTGKFPKRPEGYLLKGMVQYKKKDYNLAITSFQNSLKSNAGVIAYYYLGLSHYYRGEYETGISQLRKIIDKIPDYDNARLMTAIMLLKLKRADDAMVELRRVISHDDTNALAHNLLGSALLEKGENEEGMRELERAIKLDPKLVDAHLKKGVVSLAKGKTLDGETELETAVRVAPEILKTRFMLASYYMKTEKYGSAIRVLREGLTGNASDAALYNAMAAPLFAQKNSEEAIKSLQKAKTLNPDLPSPYINLAAYQASRREYDKALAEFNALQTRNPRNLAALIGTAQIFEAKGDMKQALAYYRKATETGNSTSFLMLASFHLKQKDSAAALRVLDEAVKKDPKNMAAVEMMGGVHLKEKRFKEAVASFEQLAIVNEQKAYPLLVSAYEGAGDGRKAEETARKVIEKNKRSAYGYVVLASLFDSRKDYARAADALKEGIRVEPKNLPAQMMLGTTQVKKKEYGEALKTFAQVRKGNPRYLPAFLEEATVLQLIDNRKEAAEKYRYVLARDVNNVVALNNLANLYAEAPGTRKEALDLASRAYKLQPENGAIIDTYGYALFRNGRNLEALKQLEMASVKLPRNATVHYHLALAQKSAGETAKAKQSVKKALELGEFPEAASAKQLQGTL
jgi:putative PEP-CTERM system TPR-repeat lipoprotein